MMMTRRTARNAPSKPIPLDVIFDIFTRLPVKSLMRFRCVSKLCCSMIFNPCFAKAHLPYPSTEPRLLIACPAKLQSAQMFFTANLNSGSAVHHITIPPRFARYTTHSLNGLLCMDFGLCATICNPSISQAITLPFICPPMSPLAAASTNFCVNSFGFDPDTKQYKVLNSWLVAREDPDHGYLKFMEYRVFTLGTNSWRLLDGGPFCYPERESVCIDGIIYFRGLVSPINRKVIMVAFDVQTESLDVIELPEDAPDVDESELIQYSGRLAIAFNYENELNFWILENDDSWIKLIMFLPLNWNEIQGNQNYFLVGIVNCANEYIFASLQKEYVFAPRSLSKPFNVFYYNHAKGSFRKIEISGLPEHHLHDLSCNIAAVTFYEEKIMSLT